LKVSNDLDKSLENIFNNIEKVVGPITYKVNKMIINNYINQLQYFELFINNYGGIKNKKDLLYALYNVFATFAGSVFANYYLQKVKNGDVDETILAVDNILSEAI